MSEYRAWRNGVISGYDFALGLVTLYHEFFCLEKEIEHIGNQGMPVRTGGLWFALPLTDDALVSLYDQQPEKLICHGRIVDGEWQPIENTLSSPMALKLYLSWNDDKPARLRVGPRPGIVLGDPLSKGRNSRSLLSFERALWAPGQGDPIFMHGSLGVQGPTDQRGWYRLWQLWGVDAIPGVELRGLTPDIDLECCRPVKQERRHRLALVAQRLAAELLGLKGWTGPQRSTLPRDIPTRWELLSVRLGASTEETPCLVVSPDQLNVRDDLVLLRCLPYHSIDDERTLDKRLTTVIPLPANFIFRETRWTVDLTLVRGLGYASRYCRQFDPRIDLRKLDDGVVDRIERNLTELYA